MKRIIKKGYKSLLKKYLLNNSTKAFKKRYKKYDQKLFTKSLSDDVIEKYKLRWSSYGVKVEINTFLLSYNLSGIIDYDIVPENLFAAKIEKGLNSYRELSFFSLKNMYEKWFENKHVFPKTYFHNIDGIFYDFNFNIISNIDSFIDKTDFNFPLILKPSKDTYGGTGVTKIISKYELKTKIKEYNHLVCQELIIQNEYLSKINNSSVNSVRSCLYRDSSGSFQVLNNSIRFGVNGGLDNLSSGGVVCNIHDNGQLNEFALSKYATKFFEHPNSLIKFNSIHIPYYKELNEVSIEIANQIPLCNLVSLDLCLDKQNKWRCLEINLEGQTIRFAQYVGKGFFGNYTDEVIKRTAKFDK